ncbi:MAG: pilin [Patescibacteria group bacterium]
MKRILLLIAALSSFLPLVLPQAALADCGVRESSVMYDLLDFGATCHDETEVCRGQTIKYSCCLCESDTTGDRLDSAGRPIGAIVQKMNGDDVFTNRVCADKCNRLVETTGVKFHIYPFQGAGKLPRVDYGATTAAEVDTNAKFCFTQTLCSTKEYGGSSQAFRPGEGCGAGKGKCIAPEPELTLSNPIGGVTVVTGYRQFAAVIFNYATGIAAIAAAIMFVWGGMRYIFGSAFQNIQRAKEIMIDAAIGLMLTLGAMAILRTINPETLKLNKLDVFLINKEQVLGQQLCSAIMVSGGEKLSFADAGRNEKGVRSFLPMSQIKDEDFHIEQEKTQCGFEYYLKGYGENRCRGQVCEKPGQACVPCKGRDCIHGDIQAPDGTLTCQTATIAGEVKNDGNVPLLSMWVMAVCNGIMDGMDTVNLFQSRYPNIDQDDPPLDNRADAFVWPVGEATITTADKLSQGFTIKIGKDEEVLGNKACAETGGLAGYLLGVNFKDSEFVSLKSNYAVFGKGSCNGKDSAGFSSAFDRFLGYAYMRHDGNVAGATYAAMCAAHNTYVQYKDPAGAAASFKARLFTASEFNEANEKPETIKCDLALNYRNSPGNFSDLHTAQTVAYGDSEFTVQQLVDTIGKEGVVSGFGSAIGDSVFSFSLCY